MQIQNIHLSDFYRMLDDVDAFVIYCAGGFAHLLVQDCLAHGYGGKLQGCIVTRREAETPEHVHGFAVTELAEMEFDPETLIVVAVLSEQAKREIASSLRAVGRTHFMALPNQLHEELVYRLSIGGTIELRSKGSEKLLLVVAGYKPYLYDAVFPRIARYLPEDIDVCVCVPGKEDAELLELCRREGYSYLSTRENKLCLAQNLAIERHENAKFIYKLDEDIFISEGYFEGLMQTYLAVQQEQRCHIGFVCPLLNVNGYTYRIFLQSRQKLRDYEARFGPAVSACMGVSAWSDGDAAAYLWQASFPFDATAKQIAQENAGRYSFCWHRFSIGAIFLTRAFWKEIGGFAVAGEGDLGVEEEVLCNYCMNNSYAIVCAESVFAGHFSFGPQAAVMKAFFEHHRELFLE